MAMNRRHDIDVVVRWMAQVVLEDNATSEDVRVQLQNMLRKPELLTPDEICFAVAQYDLCPRAA